MKTYQSFEDLPVWQKSRNLNKLLFKSLKDNPRTQSHWDLRRQLLKSSGSIMDNIAEGFERDGKKELIQFLSIAKGSAGELRSQIIRAKDFNLFDQDRSDFLVSEAISISRQLNKFIKYLKTTQIDGLKYKTIQSGSEI